MISNLLSVLDFLVSEGCHCEAFFGVATGFFVGATAAFCAVAIPCFCRGEASGMRFVGPPVTPFPDASPLPHGTQRGALPLPTDPIPVFCRGEAELSKTRSQGFCLAPTAWYAARCPTPTRRPQSPRWRQLRAKPPAGTNPPAKESSPPAPWSNSGVQFAPPGPFFESAGITARKTTGSLLPAPAGSTAAG